MSSLAAANCNTRVHPARNPAISLHDPRSPPGSPFAEQALMRKLLPVAFLLSLALLALTLLGAS